MRTPGGVPYAAAHGPGKINITDPHSCNEGSNAEAVITADQVVIAAELTNSSADFGQVAPASTR